LIAQVQVLEPQADRLSRWPSCLPSELEQELEPELETLALASPQPPMEILADLLPLDRIWQQVGQSTFYTGDL
jgi:hypothetical protein